MTPFFEWREAPSADFAVIGDPISHTLSPTMQTAAFAALGLDLKYVAVHVPPGEVGAALGHLHVLGYRGVNVTVPHKAEARRAVLGVDEFAAKCDSVNTIRLVDMFGISTDGSGFLDTLEGLVPKACPVLLLGAGGSARAIALALAMDGYRLRIHNRTPSKATALVREMDLQAEILDSPALGDSQLVVNATSASLHGEAPIPFDRPNGLEGDSPLAYDLVYGDTPFLAGARAAGLRTMDGKRLLVAQGARSLEFWIPDIVAPRDVMLGAIE